MNLCDSFGVEELVTAPVSNAPLDHSHFHPVSCDISFEFPPLRTSASSNFSRNGIPSTILLRDSYYCYYLILETNKGEYIGNSIVIVWNFIKVTVDNTRSRVTRRFATMGIVLRNSAWQA